MMAQRWLIKVLKLVFVVSTASFLLVQIHIRRRVSENANDNENSAVDQLSSFEGKQQIWPKDSIPQHQPQQFLFPGGSPHLHKKNLSHSLNNSGLTMVEFLSNQQQQHRIQTEIGQQGQEGGGHSFHSPQFLLPTVDEIRKSIEDNNANAIVQNDAEFLEEVAHVVVVQVHNRSKYLEKLIQSLSSAVYINRTLLIFSHDYYSREINALVQSIRFCRVMQIFYPYSMQIYPTAFPGQDPKDCPEKIGKQKAAEEKCQNWMHPDKYGNYRVAKYSQVKHHWWWKINYVFDGVARLKNFTGWVLLLEEDHYVSPDFLHVFELIIQKKQELCSECSILSLGFYLKNYNSYASTTNKLCVHPWFSSRHNMGMAINRATWTAIRNCAEKFCNFDDYNWDWSLMHVNLKCLPAPMTVLFAKSPRVFHIGDCGIHHKGKQCTADASATQVIEILNNAKSQLFPKTMEVSERSLKTLKAPKENGGWGDIRDHKLCLNHTLILK